jgi:hypothetical protein
MAKRPRAPPMAIPMIAGKDNLVDPTDTCVCSDLLRGSFPTAGIEGAISAVYACRRNRTTENLSGHPAYTLQASKPISPLLRQKFLLFGFPNANVVASDRDKLEDCPPYLNTCTL